MHETTTNPEPTPDHILQVGVGFWASKTLLSAVELGLFTELAKRPATGEELGRKLGLHPRARRDFLDALVALGFLRRQGKTYINTLETDVFLDRAKATYVGGVLEMMNARLFGFWGSLTEALRTGQPQNEAKRGEDLFATLYSDPQRLKGFLEAMTGVSMGAARALAAKFPWDDYQTFVDVGGAQGCAPVLIALAHPHLTGINFDLPPVGPIFESYAQSCGLGSRLQFQAGDFFKDPLPTADVIVMGHILHDWPLAEKQLLVKKAHDALPPGGALIVYEAIIDDERSKNAFGLLMSLNMLIETTGGFDFTGADCCEWMRGAGFHETRVEHLVGPDSMVIGIK